MTGLTLAEKKILPGTFSKRMAWTPLFGQRRAMKKLGIWEVGPYDMSGKKVFVTGGNGGIGFETAKTLCAFGAAVVIGCRNPKAGEDAISKIRAAVKGAKISMVKVDLADVSSIKAAIPEMENELKTFDSDSFDVVVLNAGLAPAKYSEVNGVEIGFAVNTLGNYALTELLIQKNLVKKRIVSVTGDIYIGASDGDATHDYKKGWSQGMSYNKSKLGMNWIMLQFQKKYPDHDFILLHPGVINTNLFSGTFMDIIKSMFFLDGFHGAQMTLYCACESKVFSLSDKAYYHNAYGVCWFQEPDPMMKEKRAEEVFNICQELADI